MKIVSLNAWGGQMWDALAAWLPYVAPDVLCLQEVTRAPVPSPAWLTYRDAYRKLDQRADVFGDVSALLPDHQASFAPATRGFLEDAHSNPVVSEHGLGVWVRRDLAVTGRAQAFIHGAFRSGGWGPEPVPRTMQVMRIEDPETGKNLCIGHLHGLRDPDGKGDTPARAAQTARIVKVFQSLCGPHDNGVLGGDFNLLPDSACFDRLHGIGLHNLIAHHGITDTRTTLYAKPQRFADYMLVTRDLLGAGFSVPGKPEVSDHRPLILEL
ncbi:endonuclease/exonuclease/phosphatase family protein [uncultured Tateyamaria sp.]|uniref:endonuclease/exonuclease/phosphatase family protein n=1 Tax=uncultured Tateyamaria sp. TaxID=455651 RepID=UPI002604F18D|nr:endonuclease/exonuclease/phosphatase family protein [uncultured Tateyamaria sp.]